MKDKSRAKLHAALPGQVGTVVVRMVPGQVGGGGGGDDA